MKGSRLGALGDAIGWRDGAYVESCRQCGWFVGIGGRVVVLRRELNDSARAYRKVNDKETG